MTASVHRRSLSAALAACAATLAAACAPSAPAVPPSPRGDAATEPAPASWNAQSSAAEIVAWAADGCRRPAGGRDACIERALIGLVEQVGIAKSMEVLDALAGADAEVARNAHPLAHGLGIAAYRSPETVAATFAACPVSQMSGCPHGVIQGYFLDLARRGQRIGTAELDALCAPHAQSRFLLVQCAHGMGHGLMAVHGNHLPMALQSCDLPTDEFLRVQCYGGAFMENVVSVTHPHHTAGGHAATHGGGHGADAAPAANGHAGHGGQAHHAHGSADGEPAMQHGGWRALDPGDPLYPCNAVALKYQDSCWAIQTAAVLFFNGGDVAATARVCEQAGTFVGTCFVSLGRDLTAYAERDPARILEMCGRAGRAVEGRGQLWCALGAVTTLVNYTADPGDGMRFCRAVDGAEAKRECYRVVGDLIATLVTGAEARERSCLAAESAFVADCRRGAEAAAAGRGGDDE